MSDSPEAPALDLTRAPRGELDAARLVAAVAALGDLAERHYLELKGPRDLDSKPNKQKVAKFILGAANRMPDRAAEAFEGYGVMVIGITENGIEGIPPIEVLALSQVIQPFLGASGPRWDVVRVSVENSSNQVLIVLVDPPQTGQPPFICRASGEGLQNGRIYYRADGETREPTSDELDLLMTRGATKPEAPVDLEISVVRKVTPLVVDDARTLESFIARTRQRLLAAMPQPKPEPPAPTPAPAAFSSGAPKTLAELARSGSAFSQIMSSVNAASGIAAALSGEQLEQRTRDEYLAEIDRWEEVVRELWPEVVESFLAHVAPSNEVRVKNKTETFLHDVEVTLHLEGAVESLEYEWHKDQGPDMRDLKLPRPPRKWGPTKRDFGLSVPDYHLAALSASSNLAPRAYVPPDTTWKNTGSVTVGVSVGDLRPKAIFESDDEESILILRGEVPEKVTGTWEATVRGYNQVFTGELSVEVADPDTLTNALRAFLKLD